MPIADKTMMRSLLIGVFLLVTACAGRTEQFYPGPERPHDEIAILEWGDAWVISVDGQRKPGFREGTVYGGIRRLLLLPGPHQIEFGRHIRKVGWRGGYGVVNMQAGHTYVVRVKSCYGFGILSGCKPYTGSSWLEDKTTGEIVISSKDTY